MTERRHVFLIGFRGAGKTTVAKHLASLLQIEVAEMDQAIEALAGKSITSIFVEDGEDTFRDIETSILQTICRSSRSTYVVSTGGGVILRPENRELIGTHGIAVYLQATPETLWNRVQEDSAARPSLQKPGQAIEGLAEMVEVLKRREPLYRETADLIISTEDQSPEQIATTICRSINENRGGMA